MAALYGFEPMTFTHALQAFHSGAMTQEELLSEVYRELSTARSTPEGLLATLREEQAARPLAHDTLECIVTRIESWPRDPTIVTASSGEPSNVPALAQNAPPTIVLGDTGDGGTNRTIRVGVGSVLQGRFSLISIIGEGGMSRVFKAIDLRKVEAGAHDPYVAVKVLTVPFSHYFGSISALQREAHKLQSLTHQNIVRVIDCDRDGQTVFMTMEYLSGQSLYKRLRDLGGAPLPAAEAESVIAAIGRALAYAHHNKIVHGDLKPGNVIVADDGNVKVIDFGMARFIAQQLADREQGAVAVPKEPVAMTPRYASPELLAGQEATPADDVYAFACLAYEISTGRHPFAVGGASARREPGVRPEKPAQMSVRRFRALSSALEFSRERRTASIEQFAREFGADNERSPMKWAAAIAIAGFLIVAAIVWQSRESPLVSPPGPGSILRDCATCPLLKAVPGGRFVQGDKRSGAAAAAAEMPARTVIIAYPFAMSIDEITVGEFREFVEASGHRSSGCNTYDGDWHFDANAGWDHPGFPQTDSYPAVCVSWDDAAAYAGWLAKKSGFKYRLPSASEWEYAARAGAGADAASPVQVCDQANVADQSAEQRYPGWKVFACNDHFVNTAPVGSFKANAFGLHDMLGNAFEWTQDCWHADYRGAPIDGSAHAEEPCSEREARGASWFSSTEYVRSGYRNRFAHDYRSSSLGFRLVRGLSQ